MGGKASDGALRFDWLGEALPPGHWPEPLRAGLCDVMKRLGWAAVQDGEFGPLERLYNDFAIIFPRMMIDARDVDRAADLYTLMHIMLWRRTQPLAELKRFNADVVGPFAAFLARHFPKRSPAASDRSVPRIAYISETSDLFGSNAIARITVSLILGQNALRQPEDWPILYCIAKPAPCLIGFAAEHGLRIRDMTRETPSRTAEAILDQLEADGIDIVISDTNGAVATMVLERRPVPVQVFHENGFAAWSISELDLALMGVTQPSAGLFEPRVDVHQTPRNTAFVFQRQPRPPEMAEAVRGVLCSESGVARPSVVYGVYGRMAKITADYMAVVDEILRRDPNAIFFAGGTGRISPILDCKLSSPAGDRMIIYNKFIDGHVISDCIDIFLDTFPFPGGMSCVEVQARGVPVVWLAPASDEELCLVADHRDDRLRARDASHYVDLARKAADPAAWGDFSDAAFEIARRHGDMSEQAMLVERLLADAWAKARTRKSLAA